MPTFPTLASGSAVVHTDIEDEPLATYPLTLNTQWGTKVVKFTNDSEQRWTSRQKLMSMTIEYSGVNGYDASLVLDFFRTMKGAYVNASLTNTFDITVNGVNYTYCAFDQDSLQPRESRQKSNRFSFTLSLRKLRIN